MSIYLRSDIEGLNHISFSLEYNSKNLSSQHLDKLIANLSQSLNNLQFHIKDGFTPLTEDWRSQIIYSLENLNQTISLVRDDEQKNKIQSIKDKIISIQSSIEIAPSFDVKKHHSNVIPIAFFCDFDCPDHNHAIINRLEDAIQQKGPSFITTRSLLRGEGLKSGIKDQLIKSEKLCLENKDDWDIYQKGELLIFIPKSLYPNLNGFQKLQALDFKTDENLKLISAREAVSESQKSSKIQDFIDLFIEQPLTNKLFMLFGHGGSDTVGALKEKNYLKFSNFLDKQRCKGLVVWSCSSGGVSSLLNIPESQISPKFIDQEKSHSFPVIVCSIGDFTTALQPVEKQIMKFINEIGKFTESSKGQTVEELRKRIESLEGGKETKVISFIKLYPAHSAGIPGGFRPIGEGSKGFNITYATVKKAGLNIASTSEGKKIGLAKEPKIVVPPQTEFLLIHPLVIEVPLIFTKKNPVLMSMTPGSGHHFLKSLKLSESEHTNSIDFIKKTLDFHKELSHGCKGFFIEELNHKGTKIYHVIFKISSKEARCGWREGIKYYMTFPKRDQYNQEIIVPIEVSRIEYATLCYETSLITKGSEKALRSVSAGYESDSIFQEALKEADFYPTYEKYLLFNHKILTSSEVEDWLLEYIQKQELRYKYSLIAFLIKQGNPSLALKLFNESHLTWPEFSNLKFFDNPILSYAIEANHADLVEHLLKSANTEAFNIDGNPPLHQAISQLAALYKECKQGILNASMIKEKEKILDLLLQHGCGINTKNKRGWTAIALALSHRHLVEKLINKGASLKQVNTEKGLTHYDISIGRSDESIDLLIEFGVIPGPNVLNLAIELKDTDLLKKLLKAGANPFEIDPKGRVPLIEAILRAPAKVVKLLLDRENCDLNVKDKNGLTPLEAAFIVGNQEKIQLLREAKAEISDISNLKSSLKSVFFRYVATQDIESFQEMLKFSHHDDLEVYVADYLLKGGYVNILKKLIATGYINVALKTHSGQQLFEEIIKSGNHSLIEISINAFNFLKANHSDKLFGDIIELNDLNLVQLAVKQGANIQRKVKTDGELQPLQQTKIFTKEGKEIFKWLVEQGADLNTESQDHQASFTHAIMSCDFELVDYCIKKGAKLTKENAANLFSFILKFGDWEFAKWILNPNSPNTSSNHTQLFNFLLSEGVNFDFKPENLIEIVRRGDIKLIEHFLQQELTLNSQLQEGILTACCEKGDSTLLQFLLKHKVLPESFSSLLINDAKKQQLWSLIATHQDGKDFVELLLKFKLPPLLENGTNIALQCAISAKNFNLMTLLKESGFRNLKGIKNEILRDLRKEENKKLLKFIEYNFYVYDTILEINI